MIKRVFKGINIFLPGGVTHKVTASSGSWHMPDGTKTTNRPKDGSILHTFDSQGVGTTWQWDDFLESWHNVTIAKPNNHNTATFSNQGYTYNLDGPVEPINVLGVLGHGQKCECGSEKVGSPKHSSWCAKYDPRT